MIYKAKFFAATILVILLFNAISARASFNDYGVDSNNPTYFIKYRKALMQVLNGTGSCTIFMCGDSTTNGYNSTGTNAHYNASPAGRLRELLNAHYAPTVEGLVYMIDNGESGTGLDGLVDNRFTKGTGIVQSVYGGPCNQCFYMTPAGVGGYQFTPTIQWDSVSLYGVSTADPAGTVLMPILVDGVSIGNSDAGGPGVAAKTCFKHTYTTVKGYHTLQLGPPTGGNPQQFGVSCFDSTLNAIRIVNGGINGAATGPYAGTDSLKIFPVIAPDLTFINLGINDTALSIPLATSIANTQALITAAKATGDVILVGTTPYSSGTVVNLPPYIRAMKELAVKNQVGFIDLYSRVRSQALADGGSPTYYTSDGTHLSNLGNSDVATVYYNYLLDVAGGGLSSPFVSAQITPATKVVRGLTAAQLNSMNTTPITLVPAPGAGKMIIPDEVTFKMTRTATAFTGGGNVQIKHAGGNALVNDFPSTILTTAGAATTIDTHIPIDFVGTENAALQLSNLTANFATGTGTAEIELTYHTK